MSVSQLESFEPRRLMSVVPVTNTNDSGAGSLRQAVHDAVAGDTVDLSALTGTITLTSGQITADKNLTIVGNDETNTVISGGDDSHVFVVNSGATLTLRNMTVTGGTSDTSGGAILNRGSLALDTVTVSDSTAYLYGGGIYSDGNGTVTIDNATITGNTAQGALEASGGGLYMHGGTLVVNNSTFDNNQAVGQSNAGLQSGLGTGGGIYLNGTADSTITDSTFGDNTAQGGTGGALAVNGQAYGGAVFTNTTYQTLLQHDTIAYNDATGGGSKVLNTMAVSQGGGVYSAANTTAATLQNSIVALNSASNQPDILSSLVRTLGNNLIGVYSGTTLSQGLLGDKVGTVVQPLAPGLSDTLARNGGHTFTYALQAGSPAIDAGMADGSPTDQRGLFRRNAPDIGAYESSADHPPKLATISGQPVADTLYSQPIAVVDADNDPITITSKNLPDWLSIKTIDGVPTLVGKPTEANAAAPTTIRLDASDGIATTSMKFTIKVNIPGIDLSPSGLLRLNGTEFDDVLSVTLLKRHPDIVRVFRDGFKRNFPLAAVRRVQLFAFGGNDAVTIDVGKIKASIDAGDGNDTVQSGAGNDYIFGGAGDDSLLGGAGNDRIEGGSGNDSIWGQNGNDTLHGGDGNDFLQGGTGSDHLFGDGGTDHLASNDGDGNDTLDGGEGKDSSAYDVGDKLVEADLRA